jgi:hypothetical protein
MRLLMYKDEDKRREASRERMRKMRSKDVTPTENVTPDVTPYQEVVPEDTVTHPDIIQCGAITYQWHATPSWLQRSYMGSNHKWESMLVCVPDYTRPAILGKVGGGDGVGGLAVGCASGMLPSDTQVILKGV